MRKVEARHIDQLLAILDDHRKAFFEPPPEQRPQRLYFLDSDVMSSYIDGTVRDKDFGWASLFSLDEIDHDRHRTTARSPEADELTTAIDQAISRFLFGQFNRQLDAQQRRYYLSPEHERELRVIIYTVLHHVAALSEEWQHQLQAEYLKLCGNDELSAEQALRTAEEIFHMLSDHAPIGRVPRAYAIHHDYTTLLSTNIIRTPDGRRGSFIFSAEGGEYQEHFLQFYQDFFTTFLEQLASRHPGAEKYFLVKRIVHSTYRPNLSLRWNVQAVQSDKAAQAFSASGEIEQQVLIAAREVADVASLARLVSLGVFLSTHHPLGGGQSWEICLISGSTMLRHLRRALEQTKHSGAVQHVRIVHPLSFLRDPLLYDPQGVRSLAELSTGESPDDEYALTRIFGVGGTEALLEADRDPTEFVRSLSRTLYGVIAREAEQSDRSLRNFWRTIRLDEKFDKEALQENVRHFVAYRFTDTFVKLTELSPVRKAQLSQVSMPELDLQYSTAALMLVEEIRMSVSSSTAPTPPRNPFSRLTLSSRRTVVTQTEGLSMLGGKRFKQVLEEDATGYAAMLCAAIGYIARGRDWLNAAQTMTSTAVMLASGKRQSSDYPQGNEALYLRAFLSRVIFDPRKREAESDVQRNIAIWRKHQHDTLANARNAMREWVRGDRDAALYDVGSGLTRADLIEFRYGVEERVSNVFALLWSVLLLGKGADEDHCIEEAAALFEDLCTLLDKWVGYRRDILKRCNAIKSKPLLEHYKQTVHFVSSQLWAATLQIWVCLRFAVSEQRTVWRVLTDATVKEVIARNEAMLSDHLSSYHEETYDDTGHVVKLTKETFAVAVMNKTRGEWGLTPDMFQKVRFCAIDDLRFRFFEGCWNLVCRKSGEIP